MIEMNNSKPYFFRAVLEWIEDNGLTPHVMVDATVPGVQVPTNYVQDGEIVLNLSSSSIKLYSSTNEEVSFSAGFSGQLMDIYLPMASIKAIFAKENAQGMFFREDNDSESEGAEISPAAVDAQESSRPDDDDPDGGPGAKARLRDKKRSHLKLIK